MIRAICLFSFLFQLIFVHKFVLSQPCKSCFSEMFVGINYINNIKPSPVKEIYNNSQILGFKTGTDYLNGRIQLDFAYTAFTSKVTYPNFQQINLTAGYERQFKLPFGLTLGPGFRLGNAYMMFDMPNVVSAISNESEFLVAGFLSLEKRIGKHLSLATAYSFNRIYTNPRIDWQWMEFHLYYYFKTPDSIKRWLE